MPEEQAPNPGAPFIPADADTPPVPPSPWRVFDSKPFFRLWIAQVVSSLGDWIGLIAILAIAARLEQLRRRGEPRDDDPRRPRASSSARSAA